MKYRYTMLLPLLVLIGTFGTTGCSRMNNTDKGAVGGALAGAATGAIIAATSSVHTGPGMGIGALIGGVVGAVVGGHMEETSGLQDQIDILTLERDDLRSRLASCEAENAEQRAEIARLNERIRSLESEIVRLNDRISELEAALAAKGDQPKELARYAIGNSVLFGSGKATLTPMGTDVLRQAAEAIGQNFPSSSIVVEGHTDSVAIGMSGWKSNWELGAARALAVLHYLEDVSNIEGSHLSATTYSFYRPVASNNTADGKAQNRRTEIVVYENK